MLKCSKIFQQKGSDAYFFWIAFRNNILAVLVTVPGQLVLGLIVAVLIHNLKTGKKLYIKYSYILQLFVTGLFSVISLIIFSNRMKEVL